tara:strand:- start:604 stop:888 length:285 start_codon:yes stop_codon:yes gene_type:complete
MKKILLLIFFIIFSTKSYSNENQINYAIQMCQQDTQQFTKSGLSISKYLKFCECYMTGMIKALDKKEMSYQAKYNKPSGKFIKKAKTIKKKCLN